MSFLQLNFFQRLCAGQFGFVFQMGIQIRCCFQGAVSQPLLYFDQWNAVLDQNRGAGMSQIVQTDLPQVIVP